MYPDAYEVGLPNQGVAILYEILNERDWILAERTYAVWADLEALMREHEVPQFTLDNHRPVAAFDVLGVSFATELGYTNCSTRWIWPGCRCTLVTGARTTRSCWPAGTPRSTPSRSPTSSTPPCSVTARRSRCKISRVIREWKAEGRPGGRDGLLLRLAPAAAVYVPKFYDVDYLPGRPDPADGAQPAGRAVPGGQAHPDGPGRLAVPEEAAGAAGRDGARALLGGDLPRLHPRLPVLPGRHDHPAGPGAQHRDHRGHGAGRDRGHRAGGGRAAQPVQRRPLRDRPRSPTSSPIATRATNVSLSLPSTRVDAFNIDLANELSRNGRRSGLTFAPEGGSERMRKVINKMVSEDDLIATVAAAYSHGWRQVKLYFMCGLPTETDEDVLAIGDLAKRVIATGREVSGRRDIRCTVSIGGFVPKPHTPFQWAAQCDHETVDARLAKLRDALRADRQYGKAIGFRYHDGKPGIIEGLLSRGDRRVGTSHRGGLARRRPVRRLERALLATSAGPAAPTRR